MDLLIPSFRITHILDTVGISHCTLDIEEIRLEAHTDLFEYQGKIHFGFAGNSRTCESGNGAAEK